MPILVLVASDEAVAKATKEAVELNVPLNALLQERFSEFLLGDRQPTKAAKAVKVAASEEAQGPNEHQQMVTNLLAYAHKSYTGCGEFTFTQLVSEFDPEDNIDKQARIKYASMFSKATEDDQIGIVKKGKNSSKVTVYEVV